MFIFIKPFLYRRPLLVINEETISLKPSGSSGNSVSIGVGDTASRHVLSLNESFLAKNSNRELETKYKKSYKDIIF